MKTLLWTLVALGTLNTLGVFYQAFKGEFRPITMGHRAADWVVTAGLGIWALWLLAGG